MEKQMIISIGRECGSGGCEIGTILAEHYGIKLYDRNILSELAAEYNAKEEELAKLEEKLTGKAFPFARRDGFSSLKGAIGDKYTRSDRMFVMERAFIMNLAESESFVIVGRAANALLEGNPNALRLFIYAPEAFKLPRVRAQFKLDNDQAAKKMMEKVDQERKAYFEYYSNMIWGAVDGHDFMLDSSVFGIEETAKLIIAIADKKFGLA